MALRARRTLSVSTSASASPGLRTSPSFFSHFAIVPAFMVGDSDGIVTCRGQHVGQSRMQSASSRSRCTVSDATRAPCHRSAYLRVWWQRAEASQQGEALMRDHFLQPTGGDCEHCGIVWSARCFETTLRVRLFLRRTGRASTLGYTVKRCTAFPSHSTWHVDL